MLRLQRNTSSISKLPNTKLRLLGQVISEENLQIIFQVFSPNGRKNNIRIRRIFDYTDSGYTEFTALAVLPLLVPLSTAEEVYPRKHAVMCQYRACTGPMLAASDQYWPSAGTYLHVYEDVSFHPGCS